MHTVFDGHVNPELIAKSLAGAQFGSMWLDVPRPDYPRLPGALACDLLVVGGGYAGLWTALHAVERNPGARVLLIEAERVGWAASGRNGGFVEASITHGDENGRSRWPDEYGRLEQLGLANLDGMQADIEKYGMDAEWERTGMLTVATEPHQLRWLRVAAEEGEGRLLDEAQIRAEVHSPTYLGALFTNTCAIVNPAQLVFGLARACAENGVEIYEHTAATSIHADRRRGPGGYRSRGDQRGPGGAGHERVPELAAPQPAAHRPGLRLRAGHRAAVGRAARPDRLALAPGHRRRRQPVPLLPALRGQPDRVGWL